MRLSGKFLLVFSHMEPSKMDLRASTQGAKLWSSQRSARVSISSNSSPKVSLTVGPPRAPLKWLKSSSQRFRIGKWVWVKVKSPDRRFWSMFPLTRGCLGYLFLTHSQMTLRIHPKNGPSAARLPQLRLIYQWTSRGTDYSE